MEDRNRDADRSIHQDRRPEQNEHARDGARRGASEGAFGDGARDRDRSPHWSGSPKAHPDEGGDITGDSRRDAPGGTPTEASGGMHRGAQGDAPAGSTGDAHAGGPEGVPEPTGEQAVQEGAGAVPGPRIVQVEFKGERTDYFVNTRRLPVAMSDYVVVQVERGRDMGKVVRAGAILEKITKTRQVTQEVLRKASEEDMAKHDENEGREEEARKVCEQKIAERELKMKLVDVEYQLDGSKITFFFTADERVDFRDLVKDLAGIYKTRIELRQIGVRDEAKRLGGIGSCGRKYCCTTFLQEFEPVTLRMARDQSLQVSPTKISGACGRLMCCLAYERDYYMKVAKRLPKVGTHVETAYGEATVTGIDIFAQAVIVEDESGNEMRLTLEQIRKPGDKKPLARIDEDGENNGEPALGETDEA